MLYFLCIDTLNSHIPLDYKSVLDPPLYQKQSQSLILAYTTKPDDEIYERSAKTTNGHSIHLNWASMIEQYLANHCQHNA